MITLGIKNLCTMIILVHLTRVKTISVLLKFFQLVVYLILIMQRLCVYILKSPNGIQEEHAATCYYSLRDDIKPAKGIVKAARFIAINKTCLDCYTELIRKANLMGTAFNSYRRRIHRL
jgi:hypothetical protein